MVKVIGFTPSRKTLKALNAKVDKAVKEQNRRTDLEKHEDRVFKAASHFRLQRYQGNNQQDRMEVTTFPEALKIAKDVLATGDRVLIYAVTQMGTFIVLTPQRWDEYLKQWEQEHGL